MKLEALVKDGMYHIYNRGINSETIFVTDENKRFFLKLIGKYLSGVASVYAYCVMDNHFHLLLKIESEPDIATQSLSNLFNAYAKAFNKVTNRTGSLFEKHFKRIQIQDEKYLLKLVIYIHLNPKHHFNDVYEKFRYSSYLTCISDKQTKIKRNEILELFSGRDNFIFVHKQHNDFLDEKYKLE